MKNPTPTPESLAREFSCALRACLGPEDINEVLIRNQIETDSRICHSHDFCDANVVLLYVFKKYGMDVAAKGGCARWGKLWGECWQIAKLSDFWASNEPCPSIS